MRVFKYFMHIIELIFSALMIGLMVILPFSWGSSFGGAVARFLGPWLPVNKIAQVNLALAFPKMSHSEKQRIIRGMWENLGRNIFEYGRLFQQKMKDHEIIGLEHLEALKACGKPCLFITAHIGNWEIGSYFAQLSGVSLAQVTRNLNNPWVRELIKRVHGRTAQEVIPKGAHGAKRIMQLLKSGTSVSMMADQKLNEGLAVPFFGHEAMTASAVARLAMTFDCPIIPIQVERLKGTHFRVTYHTPIFVQKSPNKDQTIVDTMKTINGILEDWITQHPEQWFWVHRRWPKSLYKKPKGA